MKKYILINVLILVMGLELPVLAVPVQTPAAQDSQIISIDFVPIIPTNQIDLAPLSMTVPSTETAVDGTWLVSLIIPGGGQILMGKPERGLLFLFGMALSVGGMFFFNSNSLGGGVQTMVNGFLVSALLGVGLYSWNVLDAYAMNDAIKSKVAP